MKTITLDLDDCREPYVLLRCKQLYDMGAVRVLARTSSRGMGFHIKAWFHDHFMLDSAERLFIRLRLTDDVKRIKIDKKRSTQGIISRVLFDTKQYGAFSYQAGDWQQVCPPDNAVHHTHG